MSIWTKSDFLAPAGEEEPDSHIFDALDDGDLTLNAINDEPAIVTEVPWRDPYDVAWQEDPDRLDDLNCPWHGELR